MQVYVCVYASVCMCVFIVNISSQLVNITCKKPLKLTLTN